jgi:predicted P-loop ATPase
VTQAEPGPQTAQDRAPSPSEVILGDATPVSKTEPSKSADALLTSASGLQLDSGAANDFLKLLGRGHEGDEVRMRTFAVDGVPIKHKLDRRVALDWQQNLQQGVWMVINRGQDTDASINACVALFCEWDDRPKEWQLIAWQELGLPEPTIQVDSGNKSIHNYWVFEKPVDTDTWRDLQTRLLEFADADRTLKNPSRVMRLPGCWNFCKKTGERLGMATIVHKSDTLINPTDFDALLPDKAAVQRQVEVRNFKLPTDWEPRSLDEIKAALNRVPQRVSGNNNYAEYRNLLWGLGCALAEAGQPAELAIDLMEDHSPSSTSGWNVAQVFNSGGHSAQASWFWRITSLHGYSLKRTPPKAQPRMPSLPTGVDTGELTVDDILGPVEDDKLRNPRADRLRLLMQVAYNPRFNDLTQCIEVHGQRMRSEDIKTLHLRMAEELHVNIAKDRAIDALLFAATQNRYHPVRDYLNSVATSCEPIDSDTWELIAHTVFGADDPNANMFLQRQLMGAIARVMEPGCKFDTALVIHSKEQGIGKSEFWSIMGGEWFSDSLGPLKTVKDDQMILHQAWIHEWGEIDRVIGKAASEQLKHFLTVKTDQFRPPYGSSVDAFPRQCVINGTTNRQDFINDHTGNRRFPCFTAQFVNLDWVRPRRDAIWARALREYQCGTRYWYEGDELELISKTAQKYAADDLFVEALEPYVEGLTEVNIPTICGSIEGWDKYLNDTNARKRIGYALNRLGFQRNPDKKVTVRGVPTVPTCRICVYEKIS